MTGAAMWDRVSQRYMDVMYPEADAAWRVMCCCREHGVNPEVNSYWTALWWSGMNLSTVGCNISPMTVAGKIVAVVLPMSGMIIFPLFTVYLTNYVTEAMKKNHSKNPDI